MWGRPLPVLQRGSLRLQRDPTKVCRAEPRAWGHRGPGGLLGGGAERSSPPALGSVLG